MTKERANCRRSIEKALATGVTLDDIIIKSQFAAVRKQARKMRSELR